MSITRVKISSTEYRAIHAWIQKNYGKANSCSNSDCAKKSNTFQWALLKGKDHKREISNYTQLCSSCHLKYDFDAERREKMRKSMLGKNTTINKHQISIFRYCYANGISSKEIANVFKVSVAVIWKYTKGILVNGKMRSKSNKQRNPASRKYNERQVNVMKCAYEFGATYSELSRIFYGSDRDRSNIYRIISGAAYG